MCKSATLKTTGASSRFGKLRDCRLAEIANKTVVPIDDRKTNVQSGVTSCNIALMTGQAVPQLTANGGEEQNGLWTSQC
jgi:hypothetical protein